jgi:hypothetical protein
MSRFFFFLRNVAFLNYLQICRQLLQLRSDSYQRVVSVLRETVTAVTAPLDELYVSHTPEHSAVGALQARPATPN